MHGDILTVGWNDRGRYMITKLGIGISAGMGFSVSISLPHPEQGLFPALAGHAQLHPDFTGSAPPLPPQL